MVSPIVAQVNERGIFDGEDPPSTTFIFDDSIFDTQTKDAVAFEPIVVFVHSQEQITAETHGNDLIIVEKIAA